MKWSVRELKAALREFHVHVKAFVDVVGERETILVISLSAFKWCIHRAILYASIVKKYNNDNHQQHATATVATKHKNECEI